MPRFTIGSMLAGVTLFVLAVFAWNAWTARTAAAVVVANTTSPDGRHVVGAVDPARGTVVLDGPSDLELTDEGDWSGGLDAGSW